MRLQAWKAGGAQTVADDITEADKYSREEEGDQWPALGSYQVAGLLSKIRRESVKCRASRVAPLSSTVFSMTLQKENCIKKSQNMLVRLTAFLHTRLVNGIAKPNSLLLIAWIVRFWSRWVALSSPPPTCLPAGRPSFSFMGEVGEKKSKQLNLDVRNIIARSQTKHR
jgi:hypothetical protein